MLQQLRVKNFRLLRDVTIDFEGPVTVLVGPNASGKSTVLEVLDFVSRCAEDGLEKAVAAHGGFESVRTAGATGPIEIGMTWGFGLAGKPASERHALTWSVAIGGQSGGAAYVSIEGLVDRVDEANPRVLLDENEFNERVLHSETSDEPTTVIESVEAMRCLAFEVIADRRRFPMLAHLKSLLKDTRIVGALPTSPAWARIDTASPSPRDSVVIGPRKFIDRQGLGLANVLYTLHTDHADAWRALEGDIKGEFPFVSRITFPAEVGGSRISFAYDDTRFKGRKMYASEMSDGMVAYLCLLAAVHNPEQRGVLGLDEPDANLHPSALRRFLSSAQREHPKGRRIVIVTHSNALLDELEDPAASIRIVDSTKDGTVIRKLDPAALAAWRKDYSLSDLRRTGLIDASNGAYGSEATGEE